jgi:hypothetical protein
MMASEWTPDEEGMAKAESEWTPEKAARARRIADALGDAQHTGYRIPGSLLRDALTELERLQAENAELNRMLDLAGRPAEWVPTATFTGNVELADCRVVVNEPLPGEDTE